MLASAVVRTYIFMITCVLSTLVPPLVTQVLQNHKLPGESFSSPVLVDNAIFIGCRDDKVYRLDLHPYGKGMCQ